jgi:arginyl-tRNA synthetase
VVDDGARCVFVPGFTNKEGDPLPLIVQKADGGYNYATTDLAAVRHRIGEVGADVLLYVVAADQSQHLEMVFAVARAAGWVPEGVVLEHVPFGLVQGEGGKRLRTREGGTVRLVELLGEAVDRARSFIVERADERDEPVPDDVDGIASAIGIGAVKYFDLSQNRQSNYVFSYDKMLSLKGNTAPYLQYAYARIRSILREAQWSEGAPAGTALELGAPQELELARKLVAFGDVVERVAEDRAPNHLCAYLFELSQVYNQFYEHCPVLKADEPARSTRLALCAVTAGTLRLGLDLLGIEVVDRI